MSGSRAKLKAQEYAEEAIDVLHDVMKNAKDWKDKIKAAQLILERAHGRPATRMDLGVTQGTLADKSDEEVAKALQAAAAGTKALTD